MSAILRGAVAAIAATATVALLSTVPAHLVVGGLIALSVAWAMITVVMVASRPERIVPTGPTPRRHHPGQHSGRHRRGAQTAGGVEHPNRAAVHRPGPSRRPPARPDRARRRGPRPPGLDRQDTAPRRLVGLDPRRPVRLLRRMAARPPSARRELRLRRRAIGACAQPLRAIRPAGRDVTNRRAKEFKRAAARDHGWQPVDSFERRIGISEAALQRLILRGLVLQRGARVRWRRSFFGNSEFGNCGNGCPVLCCLSWPATSRPKNVWFLHPCVNSPRARRPDDPPLSGQANRVSLKPRSRRMFGAAGPPASTSPQRFVDSQIRGN
jgi:hypothetical protein